MLIESDVEAGNSLDVLKSLPDESFDCCITSPPYYALRKYDGDGVTWPDGWTGQLGHEPSPQLYINHLILIFNEVHRILKPSGSCWVVIGDTYGTVSGGMNQLVRYGPDKCPQYGQLGYGFEGVKQNIKPKRKGKALLQIPSRFSIAMDEVGWTLRSDIIWRKPNCMPSSAKDRFTVDYEHIYFFVKNTKPLFWVDDKNGILYNKKTKGTKSRSYFFDTQYEPYKSDSWAKMPKVGGTTKRKGHGYEKCIWDQERTTFGRIKRCVWDITTKAYHGLHYAVFPPDLVRIALDATCPRYICSKCGLGYLTRYDEIKIKTRPGKAHKTFKQLNPDKEYSVGNSQWNLDKPVYLRYKSGFNPDDPNYDFHQTDISKFREKIIRTRLNNVGANQAGTYEGDTLKDYIENQAQVPGDAKASIINSMSKIKFNGGYATCMCASPTFPGIVLDPFAGSGTTLMVAKEMKRDYFGIELSDDYCSQVKARLEKVGKPKTRKRTISKSPAPELTLLQYL